MYLKFSYLTREQLQLQRTSCIMLEGVQVRPPAKKGKQKIIPLVILFLICLGLLNGKCGPCTS